MSRVGRITTLLGVQSWVRFCQQEFGEFPWPAWAVGSYSSGPPAGGTPQILIDKTSPMTGRLRVYSRGRSMVVNEPAEHSIPFYLLFQRIRAARRRRQR